MKKSFLPLTAALLAVAVLGTTVTVRAADEAKAEKKAEKKAEAPAGEAAPKRATPYGGTIAAVDKTAMTVTIKKKEAEKTLVVTASTKITKAGKPATLDDAVVGEEAGASYLEEAGKNVARSLRFGPKPEKKATDAKPKKEKKAADAAAK
jgi:hypothetical protein